MRVFKFFLFFLSILFTVSKSNAQVPNNLSFQAVIRNASNQLVVSSPVGIRVSLLQGGVNGIAVYSETHAVSTNSNGLVTLEIGAGTVIAGDFKTVDWSKGNYFIKIEADPAGGTNYSIVTSSQILSVPYALYAKKSADVDSLAAKLKAIDSLVNKISFFGNSEIVISGNIDSTAVAQKFIKEYGPNTDKIIVFNCTNLTSLNLSFIKRPLKLEIRENKVLSFINLPHIIGLIGLVQIYNNPNLKNIYLSNLETIESFYEAGFITSLIEADTLKAEKLKSIAGEIEIRGQKVYFDSLTIVSGIGLTINGKNSAILSMKELINCESILISGSFDSINVGKLKSIEYLLFQGSSVNYINLDSIISISKLTIDGDGGLRNINLPNLENINILIQGSPLQSIRFDKLKNVGELWINAQLPTNEINYILSKLVSILQPVSATNPGRTIYLRQSTPSPPIGQGLIDKNALIAMGHNVITD